MSDKIRRSMPLFPIGIVMQLTELSARQIGIMRKMDWYFLQEVKGTDVYFHSMM